MAIDPCPPDTYFDHVVGQCSLCSDLCVAYLSDDLRRPMSCFRYCPGYWQRMSSSISVTSPSISTDVHTDSFGPIQGLIIIGVFAFVITVVGLTALVAFTVLRRKGSFQDACRGSTSTPDGVFLQPASAATSPNTTKGLLALGTTASPTGISKPAPTNSDESVSLCMYNSPAGV